MAGCACQWSGVLMHTASMLLSSKHLAIIAIGFKCRVLRCSKLLRVSLFEQALGVGHADSVQVAHGHIPGPIAVPENAPEFGVLGDAAAANLRHLDHAVRRAPAEYTGR